MELVVLFGILALLIFGPRRGGRMLASPKPSGEGGPGKIAMIAGAVFLLWLLAAFGVGTIWKSVVGIIAQP